MERMKIFLFCIGLLISISFISCATTSNNDLTLKNTLSIFLLNDGNNYYFSIPVQYIGDYHIGSFEFDNGYIAIGDYKMNLKRNGISIEVFVNESSDESGNTDGVFNLVHSEKNGKISISKMDVPLTKKDEPGQVFNQYNIILNKYLTDNEIKKINNEYKKGNTHSKFYVEYTITIDNERMPGCGYLDDFELYNGPVVDYDWLPPNLGFFWTWVLEQP
jgi:hypothetical protein